MAAVADHNFGKGDARCSGCESSKRTWWHDRRTVVAVASQSGWPVSVLQTCIRAKSSAGWTVKLGAAVLG